MPPFFFSNSGVKVFHMTRGSVLTWWAAYLQQTVATAALSQGFGGGWDHVLLLLSHSQCELATTHETNWSRKPLPIFSSSFCHDLLCALICHLHSDKHNIQQYHLNCCLLMYTFSSTYSATRCLSELVYCVVQYGM